MVPHIAIEPSTKDSEGRARLKEIRPLAPFLAKNDFANNTAKTILADRFTMFA
jgi:hypothetical protein